MYEFDVEGMSCGHCAGRVTRAVTERDPQAAVDVDLAAKKVRVQSTHERSELQAAIADAGYPAA